MVKKGICPECGTENEFTRVPMKPTFQKFLICSQCAAVANVTTEPDPDEGDDYLKCIPFGGHEALLPAGKVGDHTALKIPRHYRIRYKTANGEELTWLDFVKRTGRDPEILDRDMNQGKPEKKVFNLGGK